MNDYRIHITPRASADLQGIYDYIAKDSSRNASAMISRNLDSFDLLKNFPHRTELACQSRIRYPVRSLPVDPYIVFFGVMDQAHMTVRIVAVRHGASRLPKRFD